MPYSAASITDSFSHFSSNIRRMVTDRTKLKIEFSMAPADKYSLKNHNFPTSRFFFIDNSNFKKVAPGMEQRVPKTDTFLKLTFKLFKVVSSRHISILKSAMNAHLSSLSEYLS